MKKFIFVVLLMLIMVVPAQAKTEITLPDTLTQEDFKGLSRDLGLIISYVPLAPAEPLGGTLPHFDVGVEVTSASIDKNASYWKKIESVPGNDAIPSSVVMPKVHLQVGLPIIPIVLGIVYATVPGTDVKYTGYALKWAILKGGVATPAIAIRGAYTTLTPAAASAVDPSTRSHRARPARASSINGRSSPASAPAA